MTRLSHSLLIYHTKYRTRVYTGIRENKILQEGEFSRPNEEEKFELLDLFGEILPEEYIDKVINQHHHQYEFNYFQTGKYDSAEDVYLERSRFVDEILKNATKDLADKLYGLPGNITRRSLT